MSAYIEYGDTIAFHPGWYVKEIMDESNLDDEDFAGMLGMTAEELRLVVSGEKDITAYIAVKLSEMLGTSKEFWLNLQKHYLFVFFR